MADWRDNIRSMLRELVTQHELPEGSLYLSDNKAQNDPETTISYSICIWEPEYPPMPNDRPGMNKIVMTISPSTAKSRPNDLDLFIREIQEGDLHQFVPDDAQVLPQTKSDHASGTVKIRFDSASTTLAEYVRKSTEYCLANYESKASSFGCCSHFIECSDAKKCVHENKLYSKACIYRSHLDDGRIFYGKNRNID